MMHYELKIGAPAYILDGGDDFAGLEARMVGLPSGTYDIVSVRYHHGRRAYVFEQEQVNPFTVCPRDQRFLPLEECLALFESVTKLSLPDIAIYRLEFKYHKVFSGGKSTTFDGNPAAIQVDRQYLIPKPPAHFFMGISGAYVGVACEDGIARLGRADESTSSNNLIDARHITDNQKHRIIRTNLGLPLNPSALDYHTDRMHSDEGGTAPAQTLRYTQSETTSNRQYEAGDGVLHVPFFINAAELDGDAVEKLFGSFEKDLGAKYFRTKELALDVFNDRRIAAGKPRSFLYGPYLSVTVKDNGDLRISTADHVQEGSTVYAVDQIQKLLKSLSAQVSSDNVDPISNVFETEEVRHSRERMNIG